MINSRALLVTFGLFIFFSVLLGKLFNIQIIEHKKFTYSAKKQQDKPSSIKAERGFIKDRNGTVLAYTRDDFSFSADLAMVRKYKTKNSIASEFSNVFGKSKKYYNKKLSGKKKRVILEKKAPRSKAILLKDFVASGLIETADFSRIYPYGSLAAHILGFVDKKTNNGLNGIEKCFNSQLRGRDGFLFMENNVRGIMVSVNEEKSYSSIPGNNIYLTIDKTYQVILEEELKAGIEKFKGKSAIGIIMNPGNGEVLALANLPNFEPGKYYKYDNWKRRNRAITDSYEPGSTMKSIVMSILFEEQLAKENESVNTENGIYQRKGALIRDTHKFKKLTVKEILEHSSNIGISKLSDRIDEDVFYKYMRDFGFGNPTNLDLIGEVSGRLKKPSNYSKISKSSISYGYEIGVTPIQIINAYCAIINGGILYEPRIVKKITNFDDITVSNTEPVKIRKVISSKTSERLKKLLAGVVEEGTGTQAKLNEVTAGGKTGTSKKIVDGKYSSKNYNSSFIGFFPVKKPKLAIFILVDSPQIGRYGGQVAAPMFKNVAERIISTDLNMIKSEDDFENSKILDDFISDINSGNKNSQVHTSANYSTVKNKKKQKYIGHSGNKTTMPDLRGTTKRYAVNTLVDLGIKAEIRGNRKVISQSIKPGSKIKPGTTCKIICESSLDIN